MHESDVLLPKHVEDRGARSGSRWFVLRLATSCHASRVQPAVVANVLAVRVYSARRGLDGAG